MRVLGIETSCDETSASVVKDGRVVLSNITASSLRLHKKYQGIIPEIASRAHIESISLVTKQALQEAGVKIKDIDMICVTKGPGLVGSLLVGISFAKALSFALGKPLLGVGHLEAHLYASFLSERKRRTNPKKQTALLPCIGLVVSGGHTSLYYINQDFNFRLISATADDAVGEAFDKVAKILNLGYPGGPVIEKLAKEGSADSVRFSCRGSQDLGFSFSGIKTAVLYKTQNTERKPHDADIAASFQKAVVETLVEKSLLACEHKKIATLVVGGGVAANSYLRKRMEEEARLRKVRVFFPDFTLSLDNAAMIAGLGYQWYKRGRHSSYSLTAELS